MMAKKLYVIFNVFDFRTEHVLKNAFRSRFSRNFILNLYTVECKTEFVAMMIKKELSFFSVKKIE